MIRLRDFGSFHVGGKATSISGQAKRHVPFTKDVPHFEYDPNGTFVTEQAYVQYFLVEEPAMPLPWVLLHGGGMTGAMWETTPDGRAGWLTQFLTNGYDCYVVDNVERGRAGWNATARPWSGAPIVRSMEEAWSLFRFGRPEDFVSRTPFPHQTFPVSCLDVFARQFVPRWTTTTTAQTQALRDIIGRIGECAIICHSQGAEVALRVAAERPEAVRKVVALEPSGFPSDLWEPLQGQGYLFVLGDYLDTNELWWSLRKKTYAFAQRLEQRGTHATILELPREGLLGNSHMMMMDVTSDEVFRLLVSV